jgi:hypothetical protein
MHNSDLKVYVEEPFLKKGDSDDETVLSDESFYDPSAVFNFKTNNLILSRTLPNLSIRKAA